MTGRLYKDDPLTPEEREEFEEDLIVFCDRELDLLGDVRGLDVLYAGGSSPLWVEGLSRRAGERGSVTALDLDGERLEAARERLEGVDLAARVRLVAGDVFAPPFEPGSFDLVYSAGLFHELDVGERPAEEVLAALVRVARPGGRVTTGDFVDTEPAVQLEDERAEAELVREAYGRELYGIGSPGRLVALHEGLLTSVRWWVSPPRPVRHIERVVLTEDDPAGFSVLPLAVVRRLRDRREALRGRIRREGYTRPSTLYVEGLVSGG